LIQQLDNQAKASVKPTTTEETKEEPNSTQIQTKDSVKYVKIVSISDTHMQHRQLNMISADILVLSGDFTNCGTIEEGEDVNVWLGELLHKQKKYKHILVSAGNHEGYGELSDPKVCKKVLTNCTFLHDESVTVEGIKFYGTPWTKNLYEATGYLEDNRGYLTNKTVIRKYFEAIPEDVEYLIVHPPPEGILDINAKGCPVLRRNLKRLTKLRVVQFGHVHSGRGHVFVTQQSIQDSVPSYHPPKDEEEKKTW